MLITWRKILTRTHMQHRQGSLKQEYPSFHETPLFLATCNCPWGRRERIELNHSYLKRVIPSDSQLLYMKAVSVK